MLLINRRYPYFIFQRVLLESLVAIAKIDKLFVLRDLNYLLKYMLLYCSSFAICILVSYLKI